MNGRNGAAPHPRHAEIGTGAMEGVTYSLGIVAGVDGYDRRQVERKPVQLP